MAYASWSVVFGEQPSAAKWNILGTNDASFNDGTGIATNAITGAKLATGAIHLGTTSSTSLSQTGFSSQTDITGMSVTVTVPAGGRSVMIMGQFTATFSVSNDEFRGQINEGSTILSATQINNFGSSRSNTFLMWAYAAAPSAGSHTYKLTGVRVSGTGTMAPTSGSAFPAAISVFLM